MATIIKRYTKGIALKGEPSDITENVEGSLFHNSTDIRLKTYIEGTVRQIVTNSQAQALTNKTIVAANNNIITAASGNLTSTNLNDALAELQASIDAAVSTGYSSSNVTPPLEGGAILVDYSAATAFYAEANNWEYAHNKVEFSNLVSGKSITLSILNNEGSGGDYPVLVSFKPPSYRFYGIENLPSFNYNAQIYSLTGAPTKIARTIYSDYDQIPTVLIARSAGLVKLNVDGTRNEQFHLNAGQYLLQKNVTALNTGVFENDLLVGGDFIDYAGTAGRNRLIRLNPFSGAVDTAFCANASDGNKFNATVHSILRDGSSEVIVAGDFTNYAGTTNRNRLIRLNPEGTLYTSFCVNASDGGKFNNTVLCTEADSSLSNSPYFVGGNFTDYAGTANRNRFIKLSFSGTVDTAFCANASDGGKFNNTVEVIARQADGKILVGGSFTNFAGTTNRNRIIRLNTNGTLDTTFCVNAVDGNKFNNTIKSIKVQADGKILVGGSFTNYAGTQGFNALVRLNADGTQDTSFSTIGQASNVTAILADFRYDQSFLAAGSFGVTSVALISQLNGSFSDLSYEAISWRESLTMSFVAIPDPIIVGQPNRLILVSKSKYYKPM
jgi:uncharacterized delta-60 repeat protein